MAGHIAYVHGDTLKQKQHLEIFAPVGLLLGAASWGIIWYPYRILQDMGLSGVSSSFYTYVIACLLGITIFWKCGRQVRDLPVSILWLAIFAGWTNLSYVLAVIEGEVMRVMLLFYLSPLWTLLLAHFWLKERTNRKGFIAISLSLLGAFVMLWQPGQLPVPKSGAEWLGLSSGIGFALTNVITRKSTHLSIRAKSMAVWCGVAFMSVLMLVCLPSASLTMPADLSLEHWQILGVVAVILVVATLCVQYGITHVPVTRASVIFLFELVIAAVASYFLAGESLSLRDWIGGLLIISAALFATYAED